MVLLLQLSHQGRRFNPEKIVNQTSNVSGRNLKFFPLLPLPHFALVEGNSTNMRSAYQGMTIGVGEMHHIEVIQGSLCQEGSSRVFVTYGCFLLHGCHCYMPSSIKIISLEILDGIPFSGALHICLTLSAVN